MNRQQVVVGSVLIGVGLVWWLHLGWLVLPAALVAAGVYAYLRQRSQGQTAQAVQAGLWLCGMGLLFLVHLVFPGVLLLAGASILMRGREHAVDDQVQGLIAMVKAPRVASAPARPAQHVPITAESGSEVPSTGETTRL